MPFWHWQLQDTHSSRMIFVATPKWTILLLLQRPDEFLYILLAVRSICFSFFLSVSHESFCHGLDLSEKNNIETLPYNSTLVSLLGVFARGSHRSMSQQSFSIHWMIIYSSQRLLNPLIILESSLEWCPIIDFWNGSPCMLEKHRLSKSTFLTQFSRSHFLHWTSTTPSSALPLLRQF